MRSCRITNLTLLPFNFPMSTAIAIGNDLLKIRRIPMVILAWSEEGVMIKLTHARTLLLLLSFPTGSTILRSSSSKANILALAVRQSNGTINILVINRQANPVSSVGGRGLPATVTVQLQGITPAAISLQKIDGSTNPSRGPQTVTLSPSTSLQVSFNGYGMAILHVMAK